MLGEEAFQGVRDPLVPAPFSLPLIPPGREFPDTGRARESTIFGVPLFYLDGRRDRNNTVAWWPFDVKTFTIPELSGDRRRYQTPAHELRHRRLHLNRLQSEGIDDDFRLCDASGPRLIKLEHHCPGGAYWLSRRWPSDRQGQVLDAMENPLEGVDFATLPISAHRARNPSPPPPLASKTFARSNGNENAAPSCIQLPPLEHLLHLLASIGTKARELIRSPGSRTMRAHANCRNVFRDVLVTLAHMPRSPSESTVELVDLTALILEDSLMTLISHPGILRYRTELPYI